MRCEIDGFVREKVASAYHPCGTCRMGRADDPLAVVDPACRVIGVERLRVIDSSIMPTITTGNLNAPTIMIGEKGADHVRGRALLPAASVPVYWRRTGGRRSCDCGFVAAHRMAPSPGAKAESSLIGKTATPRDGRAVDLAVVGRGQPAASRRARPAESDQTSSGQFPRNFKLGPVIIHAPHNANI
jgi:hypothetical protein